MISTLYYFYRIGQLIRWGVYIVYRYWRKKPLGLSVILPKLGTIFIKLGQTLSTRPDLVGEDAARDLQRLQDRLPAFPFSHAKTSIERELGAPLETLFQEFRSEPVAAASIAQVHYAVTTEGKAVAVKVLRPHIERLLKRDLRFLYWVAKHIKRFSKMRRLRPIAVVDVLAETVMHELDLRLEAAAASQLYEHLQGDEGVCIPEIDWQRTSQRVLTMGWVHGIPIHDKKALLEAGLHLESVTQKFAISFFNQAYRDGFFHADTHPGNVFVTPKGDIAFVDFGIMGILDKETRLYVAHILKGFLKRDYRYVAEIHFEAGYIPADQSVERFTLACRSIGEPIVGRPLNELSVAKLLAQLFKVTEDFHMETQPQLLLFQKTLVLVEGIGHHLCPHVNMWTLAEPWIESWSRSEFGLRAQLRETTHTVQTTLSALPRLIRRLDTHIEELLQTRPTPIHYHIAPEPHKTGRSAPYAVLVLMFMLLYLLWH